MPYQNIDVTVSPADLQAVKDAFAVVLNKLPFLVNLTSAERQSIVKTGPDSLSFVQNALTAALANPDIFPASLVLWNPFRVQEIILCIVIPG